MTGSMELARSMVDEMVRGGVREAVLSPGSRSGPMAIALSEADRSGLLRLHVRIDERGAGFLALGLIRATGAPVPVVCTSGTAVANLHPAVLEARHSGLALIVLTPDRPADLHGVGANQTTDHTGILRGSVRWSAGLAATLPPRGPYWRATLARALSVATGPNPGPVHLNLELTEPLVPTAETGPTPPGRPDGAAWLTTSLTVEPVAPLQLDAATPTVVVAGDGAGPAADEAAARGAWPVLAEPSSGAWGAPSSIPSAPAVIGDASFLRRHRPSRVVVYGRPTLSRSVLRLLTDEDVELVVVPGRHAQWPDPGHRAAVLASAVHPRGERRPEWQDAWRAAGARAWLGMRDLLDGRSWPAEPAVVADVVAAVPGGSLLLLGSSQPVRDVYLVAAPRDDLAIVANRGLAGIDGTVSTAIGAALGHPGPGYALIGDLAFWHDATALLIGPGEPRPDLTVVVVNNDGGGIFGLLEPGEPGLADVFERVFATPTGADVAGWCAGAGVEHTQARSRPELLEALRPRPGLRVVEVRTDRTANRALHAALRVAASAAVDAGP
jgi:2-succinyl-5-enolpyruvyl-6-hydroxy-3-cyclohexene-1-carboxylate synthase